MARAYSAYPSSRRPKRIGATFLLLLASVASGPVPAQSPARQPASAPAATYASPADIYGDLFAAVQMRRIFADGKTFADAVPRRAPAAILRDYRAGDFANDAALKRFVLDNFIVPAEAAPAPSAGGEQARPPLTTHIAMLWPELTRQPVRPEPGSSALAVPAPYVVPGGRFREIYYWDSYFTMLGLTRDGRDDLVESMIDDFVALVERHGHIPNGTRSYYLSRSQPPVLYLMIGLSKTRNPAVQRRRLAALRREHAYWMRGADTLRPGGSAYHVVAMPDGSLLNRYWDDRDSPRDESWREDVLVAREAGRPSGEIFRDLRAGAESGWDFTSRWLGDGRSLATIRTSRIVPVDLNSLLHGLERAIAEDCARLADRACARDFAARADKRKAAITRYLWDAAKGYFADYDIDHKRTKGAVTAAALYPLFTGVATQAQASAIAGATHRWLLAPGGLRTTTVTTGQQWDSPNGWAPLQWIGAEGLRRTGHAALARDIAQRWLRTVAREYRASGRMLEKYDVEDIRPGGGGEYPLQDGFGWTNGVTRAFIAAYPDLQY
ncbi:trehalase [Sphingomonas oleivorans]|uniref:Trehalase n=1 Tax=Sphingomonas oleivorans TaxID=1735121 RepID=A0A2T5FZV8_9SPHN|nr:alpha,alpha-trehalase TreF [Sphingomonas oleivorans]PTQ12242.1 trehalase [Sphingomonas oleivorans]